MKCGKTYNLFLNFPPENNICDTCGGTVIQRDDDKEETIKNRLKVYQEQTQPLLDYYQSKGDFYRVDGLQKVESVFDDIKKIFKK